MIDKKSDIMESAMKLFSRKGYFSTSMQEIATDCGISKGSLYKYIDSKEDLLVQVFEYNHAKMVQKANLISIDPTIGTKEKLKKMVMTEFEGILENKDYFNIISKSFPVDKTKQYGPLLQQLRAEMIAWHKDLFIQVYGEEIKPIIWDLVIALQGIVKEFILMQILDKKSVQPEKVADFVVFGIDSMVKECIKPKPVLSYEMMQDYENITREQVRLTVEEQLTNIVNEMKTMISKKRGEEESKQDLLDSIALLEEELVKEKPRLFLLDALLGFLQRHSDLIAPVLTIKKLIDIPDRNWNEEMGKYE